MKEPDLVEIIDLTDEEYAKTYETGTGGHELPPEVLAKLEPEPADE